MTILACQKRHHEPHWPWDTSHPLGGYTYCDGLPRWPYARPKPPRVSGDEYEDYQRENGTIEIRYPGRLFTIRWHDGKTWRWNAKRTHAEAITYAQKLAQERKQRGTR